MITAIVQFNLPEALSIETAKKLFLDSAPKYRQTTGLIRKYYLLSRDGIVSGGVYLFESLNDAENLYTDEWKDYIVKKYGGEPVINYFNVPVIVDNLTEEIISG